MKRIMGVVLVVIGVIVLISMWRGSGPLDGLAFGSSGAVNISKSQDASEAERLRITVGSANVEVVPVDSNEVQVHLQGDHRGFAFGRSKPDVTLRQRGGAIEVEVQQTSGFGISFGHLKLTVEVPKRQWQELATTAGSGDLSVSEVSADLLRMNTGSGNIWVQNIEAVTGVWDTGSGDVDGDQIQAEKLNVKTGSGEIEMGQVYGGEFTLQTGSGDISIYNYELNQLTVNASSGDIELQDGTAQVNGRTGSGNIEIETDILRQQTTLHTGSGNVQVELAQEPQSLEVRYDGGSGRGRIEWDGFVQDGDDGKRIRGAFGSGEVLLEVRTGSGNFTLD